MTDKHLLTEDKAFLTTEEGERIVLDEIIFWTAVPRVTAPPQPWDGVPSEGG